MGTDVGRTGRKGKQAAGSAGGSQRGRHGRRRGIREKRRRPSGLKSSIARIFAVTSRKSCHRPLVCTVHPSSCRASDLHLPPSPLFRPSSILHATVRLGLYPSSFISHGRWKIRDMSLRFQHLTVLYLPYFDIHSHSKSSRCACS